MDNNYSKSSRDYFDNQYSQPASYWGDQPNLLIPLISSLMPPGIRVLDIGCGEGRDALFLARHGFDVVATEIAAAGLTKIRDTIKDTNLNIGTFELDAVDSHNHLGKFDLVLLMNILQFLPPDTIGERIEYFKSLVEPEGIFSAEAFTIEDPSFAKNLKSLGLPESARTLEHNQRGYSVTFLDKGYLAGHFRDWEIIYYHEGLIWDKPHGTQTAFHQHGLAQIIARKH